MHVFEVLLEGILSQTFNLGLSLYFMSKKRVSLLHLKKIIAIPNDCFLAPLQQAFSPTTPRISPVYSAVTMPRSADPQATTCCGGKGCSTMTYFTTNVMLGLAIAHIVCGLGMVSIQITSMEEHAALGDVAAGIWAGAVVSNRGFVYYRMRE